MITKGVGNRPALFLCPKTEKERLIMRIKYEFLTGEIVEVEVPNDIGGVTIELDRRISNSDRNIQKHLKRTCAPR
ncbi:MAG TPA: hypothetical protein DD730_02320 [Desulfosporosinus sp.]|jgi:hypothetical protein|nr:hypothetical protein [Desulfosporosinus sp.]